nr:immunoglobulin heavy chain junction region [Macaca mulatta]MOY21367.1 immunoglobulin heavy chain junction region [Macaca mulatta]MOY21487.1 immunoglobulin heavy chain junction region [Macaca mulatta]MOY21573.1 immunoglobulin heavy chain junction region [Macaca mulatta]MOY21664.1 immunoglobulin heavy chain junction region [Macaca mulatta]
CAIYSFNYRNSLDVW